MDTEARLPEWEGVYNGEEFSVAEKAEERLSHGLPQPIADALSSDPEGAVLGTIWFFGGIDVRVHDGNVECRMTAEQEAAFVSAMAAVLADA